MPLGKETARNAFFSKQQSDHLAFQSVMATKRR